MNLNKQNLINKIKYRSQYRGTKELDILISTFVSNIIDDLSYDELDQLEKFVNLDDRDLIKLNKNFTENKDKNLNKIYKMFYNFIPL